MRLLCLLALLAISVEARAVKCVDAQGNVTYADVCPAPTPVKPRPPPCRLSLEEETRATRRERPFLSKYRNERLHRAAEWKELATVASRLRISTSRFDELSIARRRLAEEFEFYRTKPPPAALMAKFEVNEGQFVSLAEIFRQQQQDVEQIVTRFRCERETLGVRWSDDRPGASACVPACKAP